MTIGHSSNAATATAPATYAHASASPVHTPRMTARSDLNRFLKSKIVIDKLNARDYPAAKLKTIFNFIGKVSQSPRAAEDRARDRFLVAATESSQGWKWVRNLGSDQGKDSLSRI